MQLLRTEERPVKNDAFNCAPSVGRQVSGRHRKVGGRVVDEHTHRPERSLCGVETGEDRLRFADVELDADCRGTRRFNCVDARATMLRGSARDRNARAETCELDGHCPPETGSAARDEHADAVVRPGRQHRRAERRGFGQRHRYFPSNSACCLAAFAGYPFGMASETNSTDELSASKRSASARPRSAKVLIDRLMLCTASGALSRIARATSYAA